MATYTPNLNLRKDDPGEFYGVENVNANLDKIDTALRGVVPIGAIVMWSGTVVAIPAGWALCNGANGTPDLRDRFIVGAGGAYAVGNTGGAASVALTEAQMPSHCHPMYYNYNYDGPYNASSGKLSGTNSNTGITGYTGGNQSHENRPPYYALCFIMFKGA